MSLASLAVYFCPSKYAMRFRPGFPIAHDVHQDLTRTAGQAAPIPILHPSMDLRRFDSAVFGALISWGQSPKLVFFLNRACKRIT